MWIPSVLTDSVGTCAWLNHDFMVAYAPDLVYSAVVYKQADFASSSPQVI